MQTQLTGKPFNYAFVPATDYYLKAHLFGDIFARNNLSFADREIVTVSAISALPDCEPQLIAHVSGARNLGVTDAELRALPSLLEEKVGLANVTFEPGCRNNWHIHHKQVQVLICVAGRGWYQEWGKTAVPLLLSGRI